MSILLQPLRDILGGLERCVARGVPGLLAVFAGLIPMWWLYVPVHELLHALGCVIGGGRVWRLEIAPLYGGSVLARFLPFVVAESEYAGRLSGFDTGGSAVVHLLTTGLPFVLSVLPGVWLLRLGGRRGMGLVYGAALVLATAPFLSLGGDAYEIGSLGVTRLGPWSDPAARSLLVGDDVTVVAGRLGSAVLWLGFALAAVVGAAWALATYLLGGAVASALGQPPLERLRR